MAVISKREILRTFAFQNEVIDHGVDESGEWVDVPQLKHRFVSTSTTLFQVSSEGCQTSMKLKNMA